MSRETEIRSLALADSGVVVASDQCTDSALAENVLAAVRREGYAEFVIALPKCLKDTVPGVKPMVILRKELSPEQRERLMKGPLGDLASKVTIEEQEGTLQIEKDLRVRPRIIAYIQLWGM
jgi:hypothetical protein